LLNATMGKEDPRKVVGSRVSAKACHVTNLAECARRYGANKQTKVVQGTVLSCEATVNSKTHRSSWFVVAEYDLGGGTLKKARLNIRSVKAVVDDVIVAPTDAVVAAAVGEPEAAAPQTPPKNPVDDAQWPVDTPDAFMHENERESPKTPVQPSPARGATLFNALTTLFNGTPAAAAVVRAEPAVAPPVAPPPVAPVASPTAVAVAHDYEWFQDDEATLQPMNGPVPFRGWGISTPAGDRIGEKGDVQLNYSRLDYFLFMFPPTQLTTTCSLTNEELLKHEKKATTKGELLRFFGIMILATRYEFRTRASLWSNVSPYKYVESPSFGRTGMSRTRFDDLWKNIRWSMQPKERPEGMSSEQYRWMLIDDFVDRFNEHRSQTFVPSDLICVDESFSRWYGQGGHWINHGLPHYVEMDRKPEAGCEIQNSACGRSGVMLQLRLVKSAREEHTTAEDNDEGLNHGTIILKKLVNAWCRSNRIVCADSYFASVNAATEMQRMGLRFIGVVKTATRKFPMAYLSSLELEQRGDWKGLVAKGTDGKPKHAGICVDGPRQEILCCQSWLNTGWHSV
jgi:Transposase IS4